MLCPFVQRTYFTLSAKNIPYQKCFMDLRNKSEWHMNINGGLIPIMEAPNGTIIIESSIIA